MGIRGVTVSDVRGFGSQGGMKERQAGKCIFGWGQVFLWFHDSSFILVSPNSQDTPLLFANYLNHSFTFC